MREQRKKRECREMQMERRGINETQRAENREHTKRERERERERESTRNERQIGH